MKEGRAPAVKDYLTRIAEGGYDEAAALARRFVGTLFRAHNPRWAFPPTAGPGLPGSAGASTGRVSRPSIPP